MLDGLIFEFSVHVPFVISWLSLFGISMKFLQLQLDPASGNTLPANGNGSITQKLRITNSQHGKVSELFIFCIGSLLLDIFWVEINVWIVWFRNLS